MLHSCALLRLPRYLMFASGTPPSSSPATHVLHHIASLHFASKKQISTAGALFNAIATTHPAVGVEGAVNFPDSPDVPDVDAPSGPSRWPEEGPSAFSADVGEEEDAASDKDEDEDDTACPEPDPEPWPSGAAVTAVDAVVAAPAAVLLMVATPSPLRCLLDNEREMSISPAFSGTE